MTTMDEHGLSDHERQATSTPLHGAAPTSAPAPVFICNMTVQPVTSIHITAQPTPAQPTSVLTNASTGTQAIVSTVNNGQVTSSSVVVPTDAQSTQSVAATAIVPPMLPENATRDEVCAFAQRAVDVLFEPQPTPQNDDQAPVVEVPNENANAVEYDAMSLTWKWMTTRSPANYLSWISRRAPLSLS